MIPSFLHRWLIGHLLRRLRVPRDAQRFAFRRYPTRTVLITRRGTLTYRELETRVGQLVALWSSLNIGKGDNVFTQLRDDWEQLEVRLAAAECGVVLTGFHLAHSAGQVVAATRSVTPKLFMYDAADCAQSAAALTLAVPAARKIAVGAGGGYEQQLTSQTPRAGTQEILPSDPLALGFTSGTTGAPKALCMTQGSTLTSLRMLVANLRFIGQGPNIMVLGIPLIGAGSGAVLPTLLSGGTLIIPTAYAVDDVIASVATHQATRLFVTPSLLIDLLDTPRSAHCPLASLRNIIYGTAPTPAAKLEEAIARFGPILQQGYGMAEVLPPVSLLQMHEHVIDGKPAPRSVLSSVGRVVPGVRVKIVDDAGKPVTPGDIGHVHIASPTQFSGYWQRPDLTAEALRDGFMRTGDCGYFDRAGLLHIIDREVDVIARGARKLYPRLVEEIVHDHPPIKEACLVEVNNRVVLVVSLLRVWRGCEATALQALQDFILERIEDWQRPDQLYVLEDLPRSFLCKVLRRDVRAWVAQRIAAEPTSTPAPARNPP